MKRKESQEQIEYVEGKKNNHISISISINDEEDLMVKKSSPRMSKLISSFSSDPALWNILSLTGLLSVMDSFVVLTIASTWTADISPFLKVKFIREWNIWCITLMEIQCYNRPYWHKGLINKLRNLFVQLFMSKEEK